MAELTTEVAIGKLIDPKVYEEISYRALPKIAAFGVVAEELLYFFDREELEKIAYERRSRNRDGVG